MSRQLALATILILCVRPAHSAVPLPGEKGSVDGAVTLELERIAQEIAAGGDDLERGLETAAALEQWLLRRSGDALARWGPVLQLLREQAGCPVVDSHTVPLTLRGGSGPIEGVAIVRVGGLACRVVRVDARTTQVPTFVGQEQLIEVRHAGFAPRVVASGHCRFGGCALDGDAVGWIPLPQDEAVVDLVGTPSVIGRVLQDGTGTPVSMALVSFEWSNQLPPWTNVFTEPDGTFEQPNFGPTTAIVNVRAAGLHGVELPSTPCDAPPPCARSCPRAPIAIPGGEVDLGDIRLGELGSIAGSLHTSAGDPRIGSQVDLAWGSSSCPLAPVFTQTDGSWAASALAQGAYTARVLPEPPWSGALWDRGPCVGCNHSSGTPIELSVGETVEDIELVVGPTGSIAGLLLDAASGMAIPTSDFIAVKATSPAGTVSLFPAADGSWALEGLPARPDWRVSSHFGLGPLHDWQMETWPNAGCGRAQVCPAGLGSTIEVVGGEDVGGIEIQLEKLPMVTVTTALDQPELLPLLTQDVSVVSYGPTGDGQGGAQGMVGGSLLLRRLTPGAGNTILAQHGPSDRARWELWDNLPCPLGSCLPTSGSPLVLGLGAQAMVSVSFSPPPGLTGVVRSRFGEPLAGASVWAHQPDNAEAGSTTFANGRYFANLPAGSARVAAGAAGYQSIVLPDLPCAQTHEFLPFCNLTGGTVFAVGDDPPTSLDIVLDPEGTLFADGFETGDAVRWSLSVPGQ